MKSYCSSEAEVNDTSNMQTTKIEEPPIPSTISPLGTGNRLFATLDGDQSQRTGTSAPTAPNERQGYNPPSIRSNLEFDTTRSNSAIDGEMSEVLEQDLTPGT